MESEWQLQDAKRKLGQLIKRAASGDAQVITVDGKSTAVVVSAEDYARLTRHRGKLSAALLRPELAVEDLDLSRSRDTGLGVEIGTNAQCDRIDAQKI